MRILILGTVLCGTHNIVWANDFQQRHPIHSMNTIVVTASAQAENIHEALASLNVVDGLELNQRYVNDVGEALEGQVGIQSIGVGLQRKGISIRGMDPSHTLYLVDGQRVNSSSSAISHSDGELNWVPTEAIEQIEVVRGPMSSLYGSEALGGVVNIITKKPTQEWQGALSILGQWNETRFGGDQYKTSAYLAGPIIQDKLGINFWAEQRQRDVLFDPHNSKLAKQDQQKNQKIHVGLFWQATEQQTIDLIADYGKEQRQDLRGGTRDLYYQVDDDIQRTRYGIKHHGEWDWGKSTVQVYQSQFKRESERTDQGDVVSPQTLTDRIAMGQLEWNIGPHNLIVGQELRQEKLQDPTVNSQHEADLKHYGVFFQDHWHINDQLKMGVGLRGDQHEQFGWELSPKWSASYQFNDAWAVKGGVGRGYKAPTIKQLSPSFQSQAAMGGRGVIFGNPDLQPETNTAYELSLHFHHDNFETSLGWFNNNIDDLIETEHQASCTYKGKVCLNYVNVAEAKIQGLEWNTTYSFEPNLHLEANYTYLDAKNKTNNQPLTDRAQHQINTAIIWDVNHRLQAKLRQQYRSSQYQGKDIEDAKSYQLWHLYAHYVLHPQLKLMAGIENLTDKNIGLHDADTHPFSDPGRRYFAGLNVSF